MIENTYYANVNQRKAGVAIVILNKVDFGTKKITRDKEERYIMKKGPIQEDIDILNVYVQRWKMKKKLIELKGYIGRSKFIVGDFVHLPKNC